MSTGRITGSLVAGLGRQAATSDRRVAWLWELGAVALALLWVVASLLLVYRTPRPVTADFGSSYGRAYLKGDVAEAERNEQYTYTWTGRRADIVLPGAGGGWFALDVWFNGWRPQGVEAARVRLGAGNGAVVVAPPPVPRAYHLLSRASNGDLDVPVWANAFPGEDGRVMGVPLDRVAATGLTGTAPLAAGTMLAAIAVGGYALLRRLAVTPAVALALALAAAGVLVYGMYEARLLVTVGLLRLLVTLLLVHGVLLAGRPLVRMLYARAGLPLEAREETWLWRVFAAALLVKLGGVLYPHAIIFDEAAHTLRVRWLLNGRFMELYRPGYTSYMGQTVGLEAGQFPYSPLWYLVVAPWTVTGLEIGDISNGLAALMDVSKLFLIHIVARTTTGSRFVAVLAAVLYNLLPMPYFLLSWGNYPTQFGLWAMLLATAFLVLLFRDAEANTGRRVFVMWAALLALSILSYTVVGVVAVSFFIMFGLFGLLRRDEPGRALGGRRLRFIVGGIVVAELFCFAVYHVQFARAIATETLPALISGTAGRADNALDRTAAERDNALANFAANNQFTLNHFSLPVLLLSVFGALLIFRDSASRRWRPLWLAWLALFVVWTVFSAYVADMVLKHVFIMMPLVCIFAAAALVWAWNRRWLGQAAVLLVLGYLAVEVAQRGHFYLLVKRHFT